ncbi:MAG: PucR family transcriptional regulator [Candidatus Dormibacteria bacterium]
MEPTSITSALRAAVPQMAKLMEEAILAEVPRYHAQPDRYRQSVLQLSGYATSIFVRITANQREPAPRDLALVRRLGRNLARTGEPLEPLLHALRIGARVGWNETLRVSVEAHNPGAWGMLNLAGQVFEYIDQLSSRIAEAYADEVEASVRARALSESALFEELISGRPSADQADANAVVRPRVAVALASGGPGRGLAQDVGDAVAGRFRARHPRAVAGTRAGLHVWLLAREPPTHVLSDCAAGAEATFGISAASQDVALGRAVEEAVVAARLGLELRESRSQVVYRFSEIYPYSALRSDPVGLAGFQVRLLSGIAGHPQLLQTARAYFDNSRSVSGAAAQLHLHRQSVIYRLRRVQDLLGIELTDAEACWRLEAALRTLLPNLVAG